MHVTKKLGGSILLKGTQKVGLSGKRGEFSIQLEDTTLWLRAKDNMTAEKWVDAIKYSIRGKAGRASLRRVSMPTVVEKQHRRSTLTHVESTEEAEVQHLTHLKLRAETGDFWERKASARTMVNNSIPEEYDKDFEAIHMAPPSSLVEQGTLPPPPPPPPLPCDATVTVASFCLQHGIEQPVDAWKTITVAEAAAFCAKHHLDTANSILFSTSTPGNSTSAGVVKTAALKVVSEAMNAALKNVKNNDKPIMLQ
jgi:hypothetical protein